MQFNVKRTEGVGKKQNTQKKKLEISEEQEEKPEYRNLLDFNIDTEVHLESTKQEFDKLSIYKCMEIEFCTI